MFCHKCGAQIAEGADFCHKCGAKVIYTNLAQQSADVPAPTIELQTGTTQQPLLTPMEVSTKRKLKLPIIIGAVVVVILAAAFVALNWEGKTDYEAVVKAYTPYANSQGMPYTCGEVFDQYILNAAWNVRESDGGAYVEISGIANGAGKKMTVTVQVEAEKDQATMKPVSVTLDGEDLTENAFFALFVAYDEKDDNLLNIEELISEVDLALHGGELLGKFSDEATGISFCYPDWWAELQTTGEYEIVKLISPRNSEKHIATFNVMATFDVLEVFTGDEAVVKNSLGEDCTFLNYGDVMLGDIPAKALSYQAKGLNGDNDIVVTIWYMIGENVYRVAGSYAASTAAVYGPILQAIMESYTVTVDESEVGLPAGDTTLVYDGDENSWITLHHDGTFAMQVNLYVGYGTLSGTYEETDLGFRFHVEEKSFSGYEGNNVDEFEMVAKGNGVFGYQGDPIGTTWPGSIYQLVEP